MHHFTVRHKYARHQHFNEKEVNSSLNTGIQAAHQRSITDLYLEFRLSRAKHLFHHMAKRRIVAT